MQTPQDIVSLRESFYAAESINVGDTVFVQMADGPLFSTQGEGGLDLYCVRCSNSLLIKNFQPEIFWGIKIQCRACGGVTGIRGVTPGHIMPMYRVVARRRLYGISGCVELPRQGGFSPAIVSEESNQIELDTSRPLAPEQTLDTLDQRFLDEIQQEYDNLSGKEFARHSQSVLRSIAAGKADSHIEHAVPWAHIRWGDILKKDHHMAGSVDLYAARILIAFSDITRRWRQHARYSEIAVALVTPGEFYHAAGQFISADWAWANSLPMGFTKRSSQKINPDQYIWNWAFEKLHVEIKTRKFFSQFRDFLEVNEKEMHREILTTLRKAKGQITSKNRGILILFSRFGYVPPNLFGHTLETVMASQGRNFRGVSSMIGARLSREAFEIIPGERTFPSFMFSFDYASNSYFEGMNPLRIADASISTSDSIFK